MGELVEHFLKEMTDEEELILHTKIMESEKIEELEQRLQSGSPMKVYQFYRNLPEVVDSEALTELSEEVETTGTDHLTGDDEAVIDFLTEKARRSTHKDFINITGVLIHNSEIARELSQDDDLPRNVEVSALLWMYLNLYEIILDTISQGLYQYYSETGVRETQIETIRSRLDDGEHLMAGEIEDELKGLNVLENGHESIFSKQRSRFLRNKLGHANVFYDAEADVFTVTNGERYSFDEFMEEYEILYQFMVDWLYQINDEDANIEATTDEFLEEISRRYSRKFLKIERGYRREFNKYIFEIKE